MPDHSHAPETKDELAITLQELARDMMAMDLNQLRTAAQRLRYINGKLFALQAAAHGIAKPPTSMS